MRTKMLLSSMIVGASLLCAPVAFAQGAGIGDWPVETDTDSMYHFERMACFQNPQQVNCIGFDNSAQQAPAVAAPAPAPAQRPMNGAVTTHRG